MSNVLTIEEYLIPDQLAHRISNYYIDWESRRQVWVKEKEEIMRYVYATDTTKTSNSKLPWSNKTTLPKLCQIRDNLSANYMMSMFPKRKWVIWEGATPASASNMEDVQKKKSIESYMTWVNDRNEFFDEMAKLVLDYIDYGNCFSTVEWVDKRNTVDVQTSEGLVNKEQVGYVGPMIRRISPLDIVFNPTASDFASTPKIIRSLVSLGEIKEMLSRVSMSDKEREDAQALYQYLKDLRLHASALSPDNSFTKDAIYQISGFTSYQDYLASNYVEVLTFLGDMYDEGTDTFYRNQVIKVVDRHKIFSNRKNDSFFGTAPIYHAGWRVRPDNLWAMGPLDNLVGMQYRIDHLENLKADVFDLVAYPPQVITGYVEDYTWGPFEKIYVGDDGKVDLLSPDVQALQADTQIAILQQQMEEMSGSPKEAMGFRTPGEKTKYEFQRLENAASRIYQNRINHFERQQTENLLNAELELARRHMDETVIRVFDDTLKIAVFEKLTPQDITGNGRIKPVAARHFAEQANMIQDLSNFYQSAIGQDPDIKAHISSIGLAKLMEGLLSIEDYNLVQPFIRLSEQADAQRMMNVHQEQVAMETMTPSGIFEGDSDRDIVNKNVASSMASAPQGPGGAPANGEGPPQLNQRASPQPPQGAY